MKNQLLSVFICGVILATGCTQEGKQGQKTESIPNAAQSMARSQSVQRAFSDGRIQVMQQDEQTKHSILQNTMKEQEIITTDAELRQRLIAFNAKMNQLMTNHPTGKEQLMASTLTVMDGINADTKKHHQFVEIQNESRKKALRDPNLQREMLQQGISEQILSLNNPSTSRSVKELSLKTGGAVLNDKDFRTRKLTQDIQGFNYISATPALRSEMADAMIPLLKDPKIANELQKMIQMAVAQATQKMHLQMQQQMKKQQQMETAKPKSSSHNHSKSGRRGDSRKVSGNNRTQHTSSGNNDSSFWYIHSVQTR